MGYAALAVLWAAPSSLSPADTAPNHGDPLHLAWVMAWVAHRLPRDPLSLFDANAFHPYPRSLAFSDHLLPEALLGAPVFWATGNPLLASNFVLTAALAASAAAMFLLVRDLTRSTAAAWLAGTAYAFNSLTLHELPRVHVLNVQWWPIALLAVERLVREGGRLRHAALLAGSLLLQCLSGTYYLAYTALFAPLWLAGRYALARRRPSAAELRTLAACAAVALVPLTLVLVPYARHFRELGLAKRQPERLLTLPGPALEELRTKGFEGGLAAGADVLSYVVPPPGTVLGRGAPAAVRSELPHSIGLAGGLLAAAGLVAVRKRLPGRELGILAAGTAGLAFLLSLGSRVRVGGEDWGPGPYDLLYRYVPFARGMAGAERVGVLVVLAQAILIGVGAAWLLSRLAARRRAAVAAGLTVALLLDHWRPPAAGAAVPAGASLPGVYRWLAEEGDGPVIELPLYPNREKRLWAAYLFFSAHHWRPVPIGRASFYPPVHDRLAFELRDFPDDRSLTVLDRLGIRTLVVHPLAWPDAERAKRLAAIDAETRLEPVRRFGDRVPERFAPLRLGMERVYRLRPGPAARPPCQPAGELPRERWELQGTGVTSAEAVRDGDPETSWMTLEPQRQGDHIQVAFAEPQTVAAIVLAGGYPHEEFPRGLEVHVPAGDGWEVVPHEDGPEVAWEAIDLLAHRPREARIVLRFAPRTVGNVVLALGARDRDWAQPRWAIGELRAFARCR